MVKSMIEKMKIMMPGLKKICISKDDWDRLAWEMQQVQRLNGDDMRGGYVSGCVYVCGVEVWREGTKIPPQD